MQKIAILSSLLAALFFVSCEPSQDDKIDIGLPPENVSFDIVPGDLPNTYVFKNTTEGAFMYAWEYGANTATGEEAQAYFPAKGDYEITLTVFAKGGSASATKVLNVPEDVPFDCINNPVYKFLTNCDQRTWKLKPVAGSLWVGPADGSQTWWTLPANEVATRSCEFNDEWILSPNGTMIFDTKGDIWAEPYMGFNYECIDETQLAANQAVWGAGTHSFEVLPGNPNQLKVVGLGAYIGLPKAANGAEVTEPQSSITYDILRMEEVAGTYELELQVNFGGGVWKYILAAQ